MGSLLRALIRHSLDDPACSLQQEFSSLLLSLPSACAEVWPEPTPQDPGASAGGHALGVGPTGTANQLIGLLQAGGEAEAALAARQSRMAQLGET